VPQVVYIEADGQQTEIDAEVDDSVMETAVQNGVESIVGECGGSMSCSTCHVYVDPRWAAQLEPIDELEDEMLEGTSAERRPSSRLSCQIAMTPELDGLVVQVPESQV